MEDPDRREKLLAAWRNNTPPSYTGECNDVLTMSTPDEDALAIKARISWVWLLNAYEMDPVTEKIKGVIQSTTLILADQQAFDSFIAQLAEIGIHKWRKVEVKGQEATKPNTSLPSSLFPTEISVPRRF